jgi:hypothetical protein
MSTEDQMKRAQQTAAAFRLVGELYLIGSLERGVTVYRQQVRAHNLAWALSRIDDDVYRQSHIAIVGGGITGLTAAACVLGLFPNARVHLFERSPDLCSLQQGCDTRWLHPRIYDWPSRGSRAPSASLPVLDWTEGRASDVAAEVLRRFHEYTRRIVDERLQVFLGVDHLRITSQNRQIEWVGRRGIRDGQFFRQGTAAGESQLFDRIILATGFGLESHATEYRTPSYWRNDTLAQPRLDGSVETFVVSGYGDGALVDLCRLTIERFRQDRILYELFGDSPDATEEQLRPVAARASAGENPFELFRSIEDTVLKQARQALRQRIRKDTRVLLHLSGKGEPPNRSLPAAFGNTSSFANRLLLFLLYRCGAFVPHFDPLSTIVANHSIAPANVICRYGPSVTVHLTNAFTDTTEFEGRLSQMQTEQAQRVHLESEPGVFPDYAE